jgi:hypothetical protein
MRSRFGVFLLGGLSLQVTLGCKTEAQPAPPSHSRALPSAQPPLSGAAASARPISSDVVAFERALRASKLRLPARSTHEPRLAFARGVFARLGAEELRIFEADTARLVLAQPLEAPRALLTLADGSLLAVGTHQLLHWELGKKHARALPGIVLLPGAELYADAQRADVLWLFDRPGGSSAARLSSFRLAASDAPLLLPEQSIELSAAPAGVLGTTREGVWLYLTSGHAERFAPGGARLPGFGFERSPLPTWALPAQRLDQSLWLDEAGQIERVQLAPRFVRLARTKLAGTAFAADVGDEGRLLAVVAITGDGPRFELQTFDAELKPLARVVLPSETPSGADDWVPRLVRNQEVAVSRHAPRVAVGGPERATIFDAAGQVVFSIPSR